jgi:MFS family permease
LDKHLYAFCFAILPVMVCSGMVYSVLALYFAELGASTSQIGLIYTTGALAGALFSPLLGRLADRYGRKSVLTGAMVAFLGVFLAYALMEHPRLAFPIQAAEGTAWAGLGAAAAAMVADLAPPARRGWAMGVYDRTWFIGWIIGPAFGGFVAERLGFRQTFLIAGILILLGMAVLFLWVKEPSRTKEDG